MLFVVELRGWLKLPGGSNYPTLPYICGHFVKAKTKSHPEDADGAPGGYTETPGCMR